LSTKTLDRGRYKLGPIVGSGGMALVYRARDCECDEPVAVKLLADNLSADPELRHRFTREAELAERLSHRNVVRVLDSGEADGRAYIVLEYVDGPNLAEVLREAGRLQPERVAELGAQAAAALAHAHEKGLVHRDVKPQNMLLAADGTLKVSDFGVARLVDGTQLTQTGAVLGTAAYLAPEQARGEETTGATDVYALGVVLHELLTGERVGLDGEPQPPGALVEGVPADLDSLVLACLRARPEERPTAREVELVLRGRLEAPTRALARASGLQSSILRRPLRTRRLLAGTAAACVVALAVALALVLGGGGAARKPAPRQATIAPIPAAPTAAGDAENLARWLRAHSR
jgi:serine/threonine-protein kinase